MPPPNLITAPALRVLIIEDDPELRALTADWLASAGHETASEAGAVQGERSVLRGEFDALLLDIGLPDGNGLDVCQRVRIARPRLSILLLTARSSEADRVQGLEFGADDYLVKPFGMQELLARLEAHVRRARRLSGEEAGSRPLSVGALHVDPARRLVSWAARPIDLTATEFDLLAHLARQPGIVVTRDSLLEEVWGPAFTGYEHTVNSHVNRLRKKLVAAGAPRTLVETVWGVGYRMRDPA